MPTLANVFSAIDGLHSVYFEDYALISTVAALFYAEATCCFEVRVLSNHERGLQTIGGVPVQFFAPESALDHQALRRAVYFDYGGTPIRVARAEHLVAFHLRDAKSRWGYSPSYFAPGSLDSTELNGVLKSANLLERLGKWPEEDAPGAACYAHKKRWHEANARLPVEEKVAQLLQIQKHDLSIIATRRELQPWEKPWDIDP